MGVARLGFRARNASLSGDAPLKISVHCRKSAACPLTSVTVHALAAIVVVHGHGCRLPV
jgi:hypothetical protein